jgi:hypothetical protein
MTSPSHAITKQLSRALSPYIQHQTSALYIYGFQGRTLCVLCVEHYDESGTLASRSPIQKRREDLGDHPRTTAHDALMDYLGPYLPFKTKSILLHSPLVELWDGSTGTTSYCVFGSSLDEHTLASALHVYNVSSEAMRRRTQLTWIRFHDAPLDKMSKGVVTILRDIRQAARPTRWDVPPPMHSDDIPTPP